MIVNFDEKEHKKQIEREQKKKKNKNEKLLKQQKEAEKDAARVAQLLKGAPAAQRLRETLRHIRRTKLWETHLTRRMKHLTWRTMSGCLKFPRKTQQSQ